MNTTPSVNTDTSDITLRVPAGWCKFKFKAAYDAWHAGHTSNRIARDLGLSRNKICGVVSRQGWVPHIRPRTSRTSRKSRASGPSPSLPAAFGIARSNAAPLPAGHPATWDIIAPGMFWSGFRR